MDEGSAEGAKKVSLELAGASNQSYYSTTSIRDTISTGRFLQTLDSSAALTPARLGPALVRYKERNASILYDSTKALLQSILRALEIGDESRWDGQTEDGNTCLYEMHQMSGLQYKAYRIDALNGS